MKIFSPEEIKSAKAEELSKDIIRTKTIKEAKREAENELNMANAAFETALANQRIRWMAEEREWSEKITPLRREVEELEAKVKRLFPIEFDKQKLDTLIKENEEALSRVKKKEEEMDIQYELLSSRLDDVNTKEYELQEKEKTLEYEKSYIKKRQAEITQSLIKK